MKNEIHEITIRKANNGFIVLTKREKELPEEIKNHPVAKLMGIDSGIACEETMNVFHSLQDVSNFIGNLAMQESLRKD